MPTYHIILENQQRNLLDMQKEACVCVGGEVVGNSSMNHHWGSLGGEREQKRKKKEQIIPSKKNALLLKTEPDIETAAVDSLDRWCQ